MNKHLYTSGVTSLIRKLNFKDLLIFLIPVIIFSVYLYIFNPGILLYDSYNQLHQIALGEFNNWHPFFHTFIEMLCLKIYPNPISIAILQILTFSTMWMIICKYFRNDDETVKTDKQFIIQIIATLIISVIPINAIYSITYLKDILFSYFLMFLCFMIKVLLDKNSNISIAFALLLSIVMAFVAELRPNGIFIIVAFLIILAIYLYRNNRDNKMFIIIPAMTIIFILLIASLNVVYDVEEQQKDALSAKTAHLLADYELNLDLSNEDKAKLDLLLNESAVKKNYKITFSDPIYNHALNKTVWKQNKATYIQMAIKYSLQNPKHFIKYMLNSAPIVWHITKVDSKGVVYKTDIDSSKNHYYSKGNRTPASTYDNVTSKNIGTGKYNILNGYANQFKNNKILDTIFDSPALCMYLSLIALAAIHILTRSKSIWLMYVPNLLNIGVVFLSTPVQDVRYLYPNLLIFYLIAVMLIGILFKRKNKTLLSE